MKKEIFLNTLSRTARTSAHLLAILALLFPYTTVYAAGSTNNADIPYLVPDGSTQTTTDRAQNGTPLVNLAPTSQAGVTLNNFSDYNVTAENQILNNYKGVSTNTTLGGQIYGNPNYNGPNGREARIIVVQVTSPNQTSINGATEIAGGRAELVIANSNGISLSGAKYINTSRLSLVTGTTNQNADGSINNFSINPNSSIIITGRDTPTYANLGLDASSTDYVDIITRSAVVAGDIHAGGSLNFALGNKSYDYASRTVSSGANAGNSTKPEFALDSSYLGGMYAGRISLIASEAGVGVRTRGDLVSNAGDINFDVLGDIEYERIDSQKDIKLTSRSGKITVGKNATAERASITKAKSNISLDGKTGVELMAPVNQSIPSADNTTVANFSADGSIALISALGLIKNANSIKAQKEITIDSDSFENAGLIFAKEKLKITTISDILNQGDLLSSKDIELAARNLTNNMRIMAGNDLTADIDSNLVNSGALFAVRDVNLNVVGKLTNNADADIFALNGDVNINGKKYTTAYGNVTKYDFFYLSFDKSADIWADLLAKGYIDSSGHLTDKFKDLASAADMNVNPALAPYKDVLYRTLSTLSAKISGSNALSQLSRSFDSQAADIYNALVADGYIDGTGKLTQKFYDDTKTSGADGLNVGTNFAGLKSQIYQLLSDGRTGKIIENTFLDLTSGVNASANLIAELKADGYITADGDPTDLFKNLTDASGLNLSTAFSSIKSQIYDRIKATSAVDKVRATDFNAINFDPSGTIKNSAALYNQLVSEGFVDANGNVTEKFYTNGISSSAALASYAANINTILHNIPQASITNQSLRNITESLDSSASRLIAELTAKGYLDNTGHKTSTFPSSAADFNLDSTANGGEFVSVRDAVFSMLNSKDSAYSFRSSDFTGTQTVGSTIITFDSSILYDENQLLLKNLIDNGYLSRNGDVKQAFYALNSNYSNLNIDPRFDALKNQIGALLASLSSNPATATSSNLTSVATDSTKAQAGQIYDKMVANGYLNARGDFTQKLMDQVMNYNGDAKTKAQQLQLGDLQNFADGVYQRVLAKLNSSDPKTVKSFAAKVENLDGGRITSSLGSVNIKALTLDNLAKDNKDVVNDPESAIARTQYRGIGWAWENTVLWGYDDVKSTLTSDPSYIRASKDINLEVDDITNRSSVITAGNDVNIKATNLKNTRTQFVTSVPYIYETHWKKCTWRGCKSGRYQSWYSSNILLSSNTPAILSAGKNINIAAIGDVSLDAPTPNNAGLATVPATPEGKAAQGSGQSTPTDDLLKLSLGENGHGLFKKAAPDSQYLVESYFSSNDQNILTASAYYKQRFGFDPNQNNIKWLGDPFYDWNAINQQILQATNKQRDWSAWAANNQLASSDWESNLNRLIDNAYNQQGDLNLVPGVKLTSSQVNSLKQDILWYEEQTIQLADGKTQRVLVPKIYLAKDNFQTEPSYVEESLPKVYIAKINSASATSVILANNINIDAGGSVSNYGRIAAVKDNSSPGNSGNIKINAGGDILNKNTIKADNKIGLKADGNIRNESTINTVTLNHQGGTDIFSSLTQKASIEGGSVAIDAGVDFTNLAASITTKKNELGTDLLGNSVTSSGDLVVSAAGDINIGTLALQNRTETTWGDKKKGGHSVDDRTTNIGSMFDVAGNLALNSGDNTKIKGSDIAVAGNAGITTGGSLIVQSTEDTYYHQETSHKKGSFDRSSNESLTIDQLTNKESNLTVGGNLSVNSQKDISVIASNLTSANGDISLTAAQSVSILAAADTYSYEKTSNKVGTTITKSSIDVEQDLVNVKSDLKAKNNISIVSGADTTLVGTSLVADKNITVNAGGEIGVYAVADQHYSYHDSTKSRSFATIAKYSGLSTAMKTTNTITDLLDSIDLGAKIGVNPTGSIVKGMVGYTQNLTEGNLSYKFNAKTTEDVINQKAEMTAGGNISLTANNDLTLTGANLTATNGTLSSTTGDVSISNVKDSHYERTESQSSSVTATSLAADLIRNNILILSNSLVAPDLSKNYQKKNQILKENSDAMKTATRRSETHIKEITDETVVASNLNFSNDLTINSTNTNIRSSNLAAANDLTINSTNSTNITTDVEHDATFTLDEKKNPNVFAALSNGIVKLVKDTFPDMKPWEGPDKKDQSEKKQRENDSLGHQAHRSDFKTETKSNNPMVEGYTISNNDADEMAYDTALEKVTTANTRNISSNIAAGKDVNIHSTDGNNLIVGSTVAAGNDINISSTNGTTIITSAKDESFLASSTVDQDYNDISLKYERGRGSINSKSSVDEEDSKTTSVTQVSSQLMSGNNINIKTKDDISILSSNLSSNNQINLVSSSGNVNIGANDNTTHNEKEIRQGTLELSVGLNNVVLDAAYAVDDTVKAGEALKSAKDNLSRMKELKKEGKATSDAVEDAEINLGIATLNLALAVMKAAAAADKAKSAAETWGFYVDAKLTRSGDKTNIVSNTTTEIASSVLANNNININSGSSLTASEAKDQDKGNTNIKGSIVSNDGNITITSKGNTDIEAAKSTSTSSMKSEGFTQTVTLGSSVGNSSAQQVMESLMAQISLRSSKSNADNVNYNNTILSAESGNLTINSFNDATIRGSDLIAENILLNTQNNLDLESLQNKNHNQSKSTSVGAGGGQNSVSLSYNASRSKFDRDWVDDQTSVIGTNSVTINTGNNTNLTGAVVANITNATKDDITKQGQEAKDAQKDWIDGGNLAVNTKTLTFQDITDTEKQESSAIGLNLTVRTDSGKGSNGTKTTATADNPGQDANYYPKGSANLVLQDQGYEKEQVTKATVGKGAITTGSDLVLNFDANPASATYGNLLNKTGGATLADNDPSLNGLNRDVTKTQEITKDTITAALDVNTTVDLRLLTGKGREEIKKEVAELAPNTIVIANAVGTKAKDAVTSFGDIDPNDPNNDSYLEVLNNKQQLRRDAILNPQKLLGESKNAKYYKDASDSDAGFHKPGPNGEPGDIYVNLDKVTDNQSLQDTILHEAGGHKNNNLDKATEETIAHNYQTNASGLLNYYHNDGSASSSIVSWGYANSGYGEQYNSGDGYLSNLYTNSTRNVTESSLIANNFAASGVPSSQREEFIPLLIPAAEGFLWLGGAILVAAKKDDIVKAGSDIVDALKPSMAASGGMPNPEHEPDDGDRNDKNAKQNAVINHDNKTYNLDSTLNRIEAGEKFPHVNDGSVFRNAEGLLPARAEGYYKEFVHPTPGIKGPGPARIVTGQNGEKWFTPDHYKTFIPIK